MPNLTMNATRNKTNTGAIRSTGNGVYLVEKPRQLRRSYTVGLIVESKDTDNLYRKRLREAIIYQINLKTGRTDIKVEFVEAKLNQNVLKSLDLDSYDRSTWMIAEQALQCVVNYLIHNRADIMVIASESLVLYQPAISLLGVLPCESPDYVDEVNSFAADIFARESSTCADPCVSLGLIGREDSVALLSDRLSTLPTFAEVRKKFSSVFIRWCVLPMGVRADLMGRLNCKDFNKHIKIHHQWMLSLVERLPRLYAKRKVTSKNIAPPKIRTIVVADIKTEMLFLGQAEKHYREAASRPGRICQQIANLPNTCDKWPERQDSPAKIQLISAIDIYAKAIADAVCD